MVRKGFEKLIGVELSDKWWSLTKLPSKYGGMGLRTGLNTYGAQYTMSLAYCEEDIKTFVDGYNVLDVVEIDAQQWLS